MGDYVHGYSAKESERLRDQADILTPLLHDRAVYPAGSRILEAGCGVGAQTVTLAANNPESTLTAFDISAPSLEKAQEAVHQTGLENVRFSRADLFQPPFLPETFDHAYVCFVLEHLPNPAEALASIRALLKPGGSITVIEGDHGSFYCHPETPEARACVRCLIDLQARMKGNSLIGRQLYPLLKSSGFRDVAVEPKIVYADASRPDAVDGFSRKTFTAMVEGVREQALEMGLIDPATWEKGIADLYRATGDDGVFCYTFFGGVGWR